MMSCLRYATSTPCRSEFVRDPKWLGRFGLTYSLRRMSVCSRPSVQKHSDASVLTTADTWGVPETFQNRSDVFSVIYFHMFARQVEKAECDDWSFSEKTVVLAMRHTHSWQNWRGARSGATGASRAAGRLCRCPRGGGRFSYDGNARRSEAGLRSAFPGENLQYCSPLPALVSSFREMLRDAFSSNFCCKERRVQQQRETCSAAQ